MISSKYQLAFSFFIAFTQAAYLGQSSEGIDIFSIDLNDGPRLRFRDPSLKYKDSIKAIIDDYLDTVPTWL
jgi:hypothetical protein